MNSINCWDQVGLSFSNGEGESSGRRRTASPSELKVIGTQPEVVNPTIDQMVSSAAPVTDVVHTSPVMGIPAVDGFGTSAPMPIHKQQILCHIEMDGGAGANMANTIAPLAT